MDNFYIEYGPTIFETHTVGVSCFPSFLVARIEQKATKVTLELRGLYSFGRFEHAFGAKAIDF